MAGAPAILISNSIKIPMESNGIQQKWLESGSLPEQFPLESIGILTGFHGIPKKCIAYSCYYNIKIKCMSKVQTLASADLT